MHVKKIQLRLQEVLVLLKKKGMPTRQCQCRAGRKVLIEL